MPDYEANTPVENVAPDNSPVADAQGGESQVEEVVISAGSDTPATGSGETVANSSPADGAQYQSQKDIDAAFGKRIAKVEDVVKVGDKLRVEIADIDNRGKISLVLVAEEGEANADAPAPADAPADAATADA